ncbi:hypothetical protein NMY22_g5937 [Coprinellus aureogranulatus]|nr:hypothetical protein NMY22_g5937 [Coprinellus aureogranulatus]
MPLNIPGILVPFQLLLYPRLVIPHLQIQEDIRHLDFKALKNAGYRGAVFDKDNCLTVPHKDELVPELNEAWKECLETFGEGNVLIVSNSAGTYLDAGGIQSESVAHHLGVPVLPHQSFKPAYSCISSVRTYFSTLRKPLREHELIIVGDRIFTDVVMANRMRMSISKDAKSPNLIQMSAQCAFEKEGTVATEKETLGIEDQPQAQGPLAIWTTGVWQRESMFMRYLEKGLVEAVQRWSKPLSDEPLDTRSFVKEWSPPVPTSKPWLTKALGSVRRT